MESGAEVIITSTDQENFRFRHTILTLVQERRLPAIHAYADIARAGGLVSYGVDFDEQSRMAARYVDRLFKGATPGELPFVQPTKWLVVVNLKTAKALGLAFPESLLARADEVIE